MGVGLSLARAFKSELKPVLRLSTSLTRENNLKHRDDLGRGVAGAHADVEITPAQDWSINAGLSYQHARHKGEDSLMGTRRKDEYTAFDLSAGRQIDKNWSARAELQYAQNSSNLELYEYRRTMIMLRVRRDFR